MFRAKGQSGKHLCPPVYGYKKSDTDKNLWIIDEPAAEVVRKIFKLCIDGYGPVQIARILTDVSISYGDLTQNSYFSIYNHQ